MLFRSSCPVYELGNWYHERLMGSPCKYEAQQGGFLGDPMSENQPRQRPPTSALMELQWKCLPNTAITLADSKDGWEGQGSKFASVVTEKSAPIRTHMARQAPAATPHANLSERPLDVLTRD